MKVAWKAAVVPAAVVATGMDCFLLQRRYSGFTGGFLNPVHLDGAAQVAMFVFGALWFNAALAALAAPLAAWAADRLTRLRYGQRVFVAAVLAWLPLFALSVARFRLVRYLGDATQFRWGSIAGLRGVGQGVLVVAGMLGLGSTVALLALRHVPERLLAFAAGARARRTWLVLVLGAPCVYAAGSDAVQRQWIRLASGAATARVARFVTDFDRDGFGLVSWPRDPAPFDGAVHPFAVDHPGNGVDEDGIGGDLAAAGDDRHEPGPCPDFTQRPDVVLLVLESFRADNLEAEVDGRAVTPVLRGLVADGGVTGPFYSHDGFTAASLSHLFTGSLSLTARDGLIDDFRANGYFTACVSGEDESFNGIEERTGMVRADHFVDARRHPDERTVESTDPGSLTVPWQVVVGDVEALLAARAGNEQPLFLYVNLQDCHFPYYHYGIEARLEDRPLPRDAIVPEARDRVRRAYRNTAANVDHAVGRVLEAVTAARGRRPACVVVGDHGESLYDDGVLGHGVSVTEAQLHALFVVHGLPVDCTFPLGDADVRGMVRAALTRPPGPPVAHRDPERWVLQYISGLDRPTQIAAAFLDGAVGWDFRAGRGLAWGRVPGDRKRVIVGLTTLWEQLVLWRARRLSE